MAVTELDDSTFEEALQGAELAVVDYFAGWCGPCIMFKPKFKRISKDYPSVAFFTVDGEKAPAARKSVTIDNLPWFGFYKNGELVEGKSIAKEALFRATLEAALGVSPEVGP